jgi:hypothetical protein
VLLWGVQPCPALAGRRAGACDQILRRQNLSCGPQVGAGAMFREHARPRGRVVRQNLRRQLLNA